MSANATGVAREKNLATAADDTPAFIRPPRPVTDFFSTDRAVLSAEIIPPRNGLSLKNALAQIERTVKAGAQFVSVTHGAGGSLRGGTLPLSFIIRQQFGVESLAHLTCQDLSPDQLENALVDHHYLGVRNVLALRGDPPGFLNADGERDGSQIAPGHHRYAYMLVEQIANMNRGRYRTRHDDTGKTFAEGEPTRFCIGVAAYPDHPDRDEGVRFLKAKADAGAHFAVTQMVFSAETYARFRDASVHAGVTLPILPGVRILTSYDQALRMEQHFRVPVPERHKARLKGVTDEASGKRVGIDLCAEQCIELLNAGAPGIHMFIMFDSKSAAEVRDRIRAELPTRFA